MKTWSSIGLLFSLFVPALLCACLTEPEPVVYEPVSEFVSVPVTAPVPNEIIREVERVITSPPETLMPLTTSILQRLGDSDTIASKNITRYQLHLFGRVLLEREYTQSDTYVEAGKARFEDVHTRDTITINDQTEGQAIAIETARDAIVLSVCFEQDEKYQLKFTTISSDPDAYFYLDYYGYHDSISTIGDEKGLLEYDGLIYKLKYAGDKRPYLLIKLSQSETDRLNSRTAAGRRVN
jgi:hypothetical protein